jgi:hypothetical protein
MKIEQTQKIQINNVRHAIFEGDHLFIDLVVDLNDNLNSKTHGLKHEF